MLIAYLNFGLKETDVALLFAILAEQGAFVSGKRYGNKPCRSIFAQKTKKYVILFVLFSVCTIFAEDKNHVYGIRRGNKAI